MEILYSKDHCLIGNAARLAESLALRCSPQDILIASTSDVVLVVKMCANRTITRNPVFSQLASQIDLGRIPEGGYFECCPCNLVTDLALKWLAEHCGVALGGHSRRNKGALAGLRLTPGSSAIPGHGIACSMQDTSALDRKVKSQSYS